MEESQPLKQEIRKYFIRQQQRAYSYEQIVLTPLFSLTNDVFRVDVDQQTLLFKVYKPSLPQFTNKELQLLLVSQLAKEKLYPKILHCTKEYRIEQFLEGRQLSTASLDKSKLLTIIKRLAAFSCKYAQEVRNFHGKAGTLDQFSLQSLLKTFVLIYQAKARECPSLVEQCRQEIESVLNNKAILERLSRILAQTPKILCHNDCHLGNLLIVATEEYILDFEFANFNYVGYDVGNFLNEWATQYGSSFQIREDLEMDKALQDEVTSTYFGELGALLGRESSAHQRRYWVQLGRVLSHLFWMIIGLKQIDDARIGFSMVYYVKRRQQQFMRHFGKLQELSHDP